MALAHSDHRGTIMKCPTCGAINNWDATTLRCGICGLPEEIRVMGPTMIARYKRKVVMKALGTKRQARRILRSVEHPNAKTKKRKAHGRR